MPPVIDSTALVDESVTIQNMARLESPSEKSTLESPKKKKARLEKGAVIGVSLSVNVITIFR
jgi:hypothetical protein